MLKGEFDQRMAAVEFEFGRDVVAVMFDGADSDAQFGGDGTAGLAFGDQFQHAAFGGRELFERGFGGGKRGGAGAAPDEIRGKRGADVILSGDNRLQSTDDLCDRTVFQDIAFDAKVERGVQIMFVFMHGQKDERYREA